jgi:hypothetical protein
MTADNTAYDDERADACDEVCACVVCGNAFCAPNAWDDSNRFCSPTCGQRWERRMLAAAPVPTTDDERDCEFPF